VRFALALLALLLAQDPARAEILRYTTPLHDARVDAYCQESVAPVGLLGEAQLWQLGASRPEQHHPALAPGAPDSFELDSQGELRTYVVTVTKESGVQSCSSNLVTLNGRADVLTGDPNLWLGAPRPNPARDLVAVPVCLPEAGRISLEVLDVAGRRVARLLEGQRPPGVHIALWDARVAAPGVYLITVRFGAWQATRRVLVLR